MTYILKKKFFWLFFIIFNLLLFQSIYISAYFYFLSLLVLVFNILPLLSFYYNYKSINYIPLYYFTHIYFFCCYTLAIFFPEGVIIYASSIYHSRGTVQSSTLVPDLTFFLFRSTISPKISF